MASDAAPRLLLAPDVLDKAQRALAEFSLCERCLGRLFAKVETGMGNDERGRVILQALGKPPAPAQTCHVCQGLFLELDDFAQLAAQALAGTEHRTYLVGTRVDDEITSADQEVRDAVEISGTHEAVNSELNREIGKRLAPLLGSVVDFKQPDVTAIVDTRFDAVELEHGGLFVYGRYRKFDRTIPQTEWPCRRCRGRGCVDCDLRGQRYEASVQSFIQAPLLAATAATEGAFHGAGREDIDARCLGTGRPFVVEAKNPRKRALDLAALERAINEGGQGRVEVEGLRLADKAEVVRVKSFRGVKTYRANVRFSQAPSEANLFKAVAELRGAAVRQRTPTRVEHRRADLVRDRRVHDVALERHEGDRALLVITGDAGLYIKELVSGDEGRTQPSLAGLLEVDAKVEELDILAVEYDESAEPVEAATA